MFAGLGTGHDLESLPAPPSLPGIGNLLDVGHVKVRALSVLFVGKGPDRVLPKTSCKVLAWAYFCSPFL